MNKSRLSVVAALVIVAAASLVTSSRGADAPSEATHVYVVELKTPPKGMDVESLNVIFYVPVDGAAAEKIVRAEMQQAMDFQKPNGLVGTAWNGIGKKSGDEDEITLPDGSSALMLDDVKHTGKIITANEHEKLEKATK